MQSFGKWLLEKRKAAKLTQGQLAQKSGISTSYVSTLEREQKHTVTNVTPQPAADVVESIARALGVPVDEARLLGGDYGHTTIVIDVSVNRLSSRVELGSSTIMWLVLSVTTVVLVRSAPKS